MRHLVSQMNMVNSLKFCNTFYSFSGAYFRHVESGQDTSDLLKRFKEDNDDDFDDFDDEFDDDEEEDVVSECSQTKNK